MAGWMASGTVSMYMDAYFWLLFHISLFLKPCLNSCLKFMVQVEIQVRPGVFMFMWLAPVTACGLSPLSSLNIQWSNVQPAT